MQVGDLVIKGDKVWEISGIYLAGESGENFIGLTTRTFANNGKGGTTDELLVPAALVEDCVFTKAK